MKIRVVSAAILLVVFFFVACSDSAPAGAPVNAQEVYIKRCATCHGSEGNLEMGGAKKIVNSTLTKQEIKNQILYGKGKMPPFQEVLTGAEVDALTDYAFTLSGR